MLSQKNIDKLLSISSDSLGPISKGLDPFFKKYGTLSEQLSNLIYTKKNGFYAFEGALHVRSTFSLIEEVDIKAWNKNDLWRSHYPQMREDILFFAEDIFGYQFCIVDNSINVFDPETGDFKFLANSIEDWAFSLLSDFKTLTGYPLANRWQHKNGLLKRNSRLLPITPFVGGGKFAVENLYACDSTEGMLVRASFAKTIRNLADGTKLQYTVKNV